MHLNAIKIATRDFTSNAEKLFIRSVCLPGRLYLGVGREAHWVSATARLPVGGREAVVGWC